MVVCVCVFRYVSLSNGNEVIGTDDSKLNHRFKILHISICAEQEDIKKSKTSMKSSSETHTS